ncbi:MAG TPA: M15 family metallopeptidase [Nakamurella sp.]
MPEINGFAIGPNAATGRQIASIVTHRIPGTSVELQVNASAAPLLIGLAREFHRTVEPLVPGDCWGYEYLTVRGSERMSFHSAGIAVDLNAPAHPFGRRGTFDAGRAELCRALAAKFGCRWGGDADRWVEEMHFELALSRRAAHRLADRLGLGFGPDVRVAAFTGPGRAPVAASAAARSLAG